MEPKVFGLGLSKTGISSLWRALNGLGYRVTHYPARDLCIRGLRDGWDGAVDLPVCRFFPHLDELHPGSKFIMTTRNIDLWVDSLQAHWERRPRETLSAWGIENREFMYGEAAWLPDKPRPSEYLRLKWRTNAIKIYNEYHHKVDKYFRDRPGALLVLKTPDVNGNNWQRLIEFLEPKWPHENPRTAPLHSDRGRRALVQEHAFERIK